MRRSQSGDRKRLGRKVLCVSYPTQKQLQQQAREAKRKVSDSFAVFLFAQSSLLPIFLSSSLSSTPLLPKLHVNSSTYKFTVCKTFQNFGQRRPGPANFFLRIWQVGRFSKPKNVAQASGILTHHHITSVAEQHKPSVGVRLTVAFVSEWDNTRPNCMW